MEIRRLVVHLHWSEFAFLRVVMVGSQVLDLITVVGLVA
jgi:hypothetical protein